MKLFTLLNKRAKFRRLAKSPEFAFFLKHRALLLSIDVYRPLFNLDDAFALTRANIILRGLLNKRIIDRYLDEIGQQSIQTHGRIKHHWIREQFLGWKSLPHFFKYDDKTFYLPFFNQTLNYIYAYEPDKTYDYPYNKLKVDVSTSVIDAFDTYGYALYAQPFTPLIDLDVYDATSRAFYHPDYRMIFIINNQGRLDVKVSLFDRHMKQPTMDHLIERIQRCLPYYFSFDRHGFIQSLLQEGLISARLHQAMKQQKNVSFIQHERE
jgi:hypothetical protein